MILFRYFDENEKTDKIWYDSSMIVYSECYDKPNTPLKDLIVTFKNSSTYKYLDVDVNDYVMFVHGGLDNSNGKALNKFIKPKCEFVRLDNADMKLLQEELDKFKEIKEKENNKNENNI